MRFGLTDRRAEKIRRVLGQRQASLGLVLDNVWDPHNVSAILRSCDAFAVPEIFLYYTSQAFPVVGDRASASARKWVARKRYDQVEPLVAELRRRGMTILASGFVPEARPLPEWDLARPVAVVFSNEHAGTSPELLAHADGHLYIPMSGMIPSLNVSVAAAVTLYEAWRQRRSAGLFDHPSLPPQELERLYDEWSCR